MVTATATAPSTTKLNQVIAVRAAVKGDTERFETDLHHAMQKMALFEGQVRVYEPRNDGDFTFPPESHDVRVKCERALEDFAEGLTHYLNVSAAMDWTNQEAKADLVVLGYGEPVTLLRDVPTAYLMFLDKQLKRVETFIRKLPFLDPALTWEYDSANDIYRSEPVKTVKTNKARRNHIKAEATDKHPAQVETYTEDVPVGTWTTQKLSGALPAARVKELLGRVTALANAVKFALEQANSIEVVDTKPAKRVFEYLFAPTAN